jgi:hypothetical protein
MTGQTAMQSHEDPISALIGKVIGAAFVAVIMLIALPLLIPILATVLAGESVATRARFWVVWRWQLLANIVGIVLVTLLALLEVGLFVGWWRAGGRELVHTINLGELAGTFVLWLVVNFLAGVLLLPVAWSLHRRRIATQVRNRRVSDVIRQTRIENARKRAADATAAARMGVHVNPSTGKITGTSRSVVTAPHATADGEAFAFVTTTTVLTVADRFRDVRQVRDWIDRTGKLLVLPKSASAVRALVIAESGSGKTVLMNSVVLCALKYGWPVFFLDAKGDPEDADNLAALAQAQGRSAAVGGGWNLFAGTADQVTAKLMRLMPTPDGANQYYLDEIRGVLQAIQDQAPVRSVADLRTRLTRPGDYVRDQYDTQLVNAVVDRNGTTAGARALHALLVALRPLERWLDSDGWSYALPTADVTIVPLSPVDDAQARLGDLLLLDLRNYLATRLAARDKSPVLVIVDEFPQLVTGTSDPGDTAGSLFETARSAGVGLVLATQSPAGLSNDEIRRRRALTSGAALIFGRSKDPEEVVQYAGTVMQMEASGNATGDELRSARAQHTFVIPPQDVREASDGAFWIVQGGAIAPFRALPQQTPAPSSVSTPVPARLRDEEQPPEGPEQDLPRELPRSA